jgi:hypothetical protein
MLSGGEVARLQQSSQCLSGVSDTFSYANAVRHAMALKMSRSVRDMGHSRTHTQPLALIRRMDFDDYQRHTEAESSMCCPRAQRSLWTSTFQHDAPRYPGEQTSAPTTCQSRYFAVQRPGQQESEYNSRIDSPS